ALQWDTWQPVDPNTRYQPLALGHYGMVQRWLVVYSQAAFDLSLTVPRYTNGRASDLNSLQEIIHVSRLSFFTHSLTRSFFVSSLKERNYTYSMYLSTVKVGLDTGSHTTTCGAKMPRASLPPIP